MEDHVHCPRCGRELGVTGNAIVNVPRPPEELCSFCLTGHAGDWVDLGTVPNTRWQRMRVRLIRLFGGEVTYRVDGDDQHAT